MTRLSAGSYVPTDNGMRGIYQGDRHRDVDTEPNIRPQARIARIFNIADRQSFDEWNYYLASLQQKNLGNVTLRNTGILGVTFVTTGQIACMMDEKLPRVSASQQLKYFRRYSKDFNEFARTNGEATFDSYDSSAGIDPSNHYVWTDKELGLSKALSSNMTNDRNDVSLGFQPAVQECLADEYEGVKRFFKEYGFNTRNLEAPNWHLTIMRTIFPLDRVAMKVPDAPMPEDISLNAPRMFVFENQPSH